MRTRINARFVVAHDGQDHVVHEHGEVVYDGDRIVHAGSPFEGTADVEIDEGDALVGPGFVDLNALGDIDHAVFDTHQPPALASGLAWSEDYVGRRREVFTPGERATIRELAFQQLLLNGITTAMPIASEIYTSWAENYDDLAAAAASAARLGLRVYLGPSFRASVPIVDARGEPGVFEDLALGEHGLAEAVRFAQDFDGASDGLVRAALLPSRVENQTTGLLQRAKEASDDNGWPIRLHAGQTLSEVDAIAHRHALRPIEYLDAIGFLGPRTAIPHAWAVDGHSQLPASGHADLDRLARSGTTVVFCPMAVARFGVVLESFDRYRAHGVAMAMGTDTAPPDMVRAMDTGMVLTKAVERVKSAGSAADLYRAATLGGAHALGRADLGRLSPGAQADLVSFDLSAPHFGPVDDPIRSLVMNGNGRDVRRVVVAGRTTVEHGRVVGVDHERSRAQAQAIHDKYRASYPERDRLRRPEHELFPPSFRMERHADRR
ncbi:chlorohydrolase family protein [Amycolatopsis orientalis]|uniref:chlorohydrolase family protein n=1 Tax=Amycolatopsis orientalis TaxID=31958 RepID=UPI0003A4665B|nr:chlorohydrolase family protein [Amycolatopsis orientalis]